MRRWVAAGAVSCVVFGVGLSMWWANDEVEERGGYVEVGVGFDPYASSEVEGVTRRLAPQRPRTPEPVEVAQVMAADEDVVTGEGVVVDEVDRRDTPPTREQLQEHYDGRIEAYEKAFDEEPVDVEWAREAEGTLGEFVAQWSGVRVMGMECRSSMCRADVDLGTHASAEEFVAGFSKPPMDGRMHLVPVDPANELAVAFYYERPTE